MAADRVLALLLWGLTLQAVAQDMGGHNYHQMTHNRAGMVMNENHDTLPRGCTAISRDYEITVRAGTRYATNPGAIFGLSEHEVAVQACSRLTITFINEDEVRHQWMVHGLPAHLYPQGMFHIESMAGATMTGTFIVPADDRTYLIHCDMAQHMEKGMKGQLVVGRGSGDLWSVAGISDAFYRSAYLPGTGSLLLMLGLCASLAAVLTTKTPWK